MQEFLSNVLLFAGLSEADLTRLSEMVEEITLKKGAVLFEEGSAGTHAYIIYQGKVDVIKDSPEGKVVLATLEAGQILGEMSLVEEGPRTAGAQARSDCVLLAISRDQFYHLLETSSVAALAMLQTIIARLRATEGMLRQSEKMAQLGTITEAVAHELDEPAASTQTGAEQLREVMSQLAPVRLRLYELNLSPQQLDLLFGLERQLSRKARSVLKLDEVEQRDLEIALQAALEEIGLAEAMNIAPMLVNLGYNPRKLRELAEQFTVDELTVALIWLSQSYQVYSLLEQIRFGSNRVADISQALKTYSDLEGSSAEEVDIYDELEDALVEFRHELKAGVQIKKAYEDNLPLVQGYPDELNQVFVHIIDNAIAAMERQGVLQLRTHKQNGHVVIEIEDNGPGIPSSLQKKIFDPFFTTKDPGEGMGLGLHISQKIVAQKHGGSLTVDSVPRKTCFTITLPALD